MFSMHKIHPNYSKLKIQSKKCAFLNIGNLPLVTINASDKKNR